MPKFKPKIQQKKKLGPKADNIIINGESNINLNKILQKIKYQIDNLHGNGNMPAQ
jgi:hypothetical protein